MSRPAVIRPVGEEWGNMLFHHSSFQLAIIEQYERAKESRAGRLTTFVQARQEEMH
jgi:hypothetical protein